jgi:hypothetical protein
MMGIADAAATAAIPIRKFLLSIKAFYSLDLKNLEFLSGMDSEVLRLISG